MGDGIGIESAVCWLERIQCALFAELHDAICAGDADTARKWVRLLERLSIVGRRMIAPSYTKPCSDACSGRSRTAVWRTRKRRWT